MGVLVGLCWAAVPLLVPCSWCVNTNLSTAMATRVKTDAETLMPCTRPLILHTVLVKGQPEEEEYMNT